ncbi:MAG: hypothetical protein SOI44_07120, partial [Lactimicrobium sp.]|uniref:hypothetical protein n=1 Tax=Lactimicrobium sp. TaxID=2563780 RepID=UPI002F359B79
RSKPSLHTQIIYDFGQDSYRIPFEKPVKKGRFNERDPSMKIDRQQCSHYYSFLSKESSG